MTGFLRSLPRAYIDHIATTLEGKEEKTGIPLGIQCEFQVDFVVPNDPKDVWDPKQIKAAFCIVGFGSSHIRNVDVRLGALPDKFKAMRGTLLKTAMVEFHNEAIHEAYNGLGGETHTIILETDCFTDANGMPCLISVVFMPSITACLISRIDKTYERAEIVADHSIHLSHIFHQPGCLTHEWTGVSMCPAV